MTLAITVFVAMFLIAAAGGILVFHQNSASERRLAQAISPDSGTAGMLQRFLQLRPRASVESILETFQRVLPKSVEEVSVIQKRLIRAGYRKDSYVNMFYGAKVLVPVSLVVLVTATRAYEYNPFFVYGIAAALGFLAPDFYLGNRISSRQLKLREGLPEALDLMVVCVEAGLSLDQAIRRSAEELRHSQPEISDELGLLNLEQRAGKPRAEAFKNLAERTDLDSIRTVVATLLQADKFGTSVAKALRSHSETLRTHRRQQVEEAAAKTTIKLVFPLVLFIFPSLFVVTLGPAMIQIVEVFKNLNLKH